MTQRDEPAASTPTAPAPRREPDPTAQAPPGAQRPARGDGVDEATVPLVIRQPPSAPPPTTPWPATAPGPTTSPTLSAAPATRSPDIESPGSARPGTGSPDGEADPELAEAGTGLSDAEPPASGTGAPEAGQSGPRVPTVTARRALLMVVACLGLLAVLRSSAMVHAGEGMRPGITQDLVLGVARPLDRFAATLRLDQPDRLLSRAFGHPDPGSAKGESSELASAAALAEPPAAAGDPGRSDKARAETTRLRTPTAADPLRVLVTGDSLTESLGPTITNTAPATMRAETDTRFGTGLVRPDFFDWATHARGQLAERNPEAVVVIMGGNDGQGITMPDGAILPAGSGEWAAEYRRRAIVLMRIWSDGGSRRVYWLGLPPARSDTLNGYFTRMNEATRAAAEQVPGARFVDLSPALSTQGRYSDYLTDGTGHSVLIRTRDGVHLTLDGARLAAGPVLHTLTREWRLS